MLSFSTVSSNKTSHMNKLTPAAVEREHVREVEGREECVQVAAGSK